MWLRILHVGDGAWRGWAPLAGPASHGGVDVRTEVVRAATLRDACLHLRVVPFDVVLLDLSAPRGLGAMHRIREVDAEVPVVARSSTWTPSHRRAWTRAGAVPMDDGCPGGALLAALVGAAWGSWTVHVRAADERHA